MERAAQTQAEQWKDAPGFNEFIEVSSLGRIKSKLRVISFSDSKPSREIGGKLLAQQTDKSGYKRVRLSIQGSKITIKVHRIVAEAFVANPEDKPQVNHKDGNKENNAAENLEWATNSENQLHACMNGLKVATTGDKSHRFKGAIGVFAKNGAMVDTINGNADMANKGFDFRLVSACIHGKRKTHKGFSFKRIEESKKNDGTNLAQNDS